MSCSLAAPCGLLRPDPQSLMDTHGHRVRRVGTCGRSFWQVVGADPREIMRREVAEFVAATYPHQYGL